MDLYTEIILDNYKNPKNYGTLKNPTISTIEYNTLCGDKIQMDFLLDKKGKIKKIGFIGTGCAISQAGTSLLSEKLIGKTLKEVKKIPNEYMYELLNIPISPGRVKCALIGLTTAKKASTPNP